MRILTAMALTACAPMMVHAQTAAQWAATGHALIDSGKFDAAAKAYEKAVKLEDNNSDYHMRLAESLGEVARKSNVFKQGMMAGRIKREMERARDLDPKSMDPHDGLIDFYLEAPGIMGGSVAKARLEAAEIGKLSPLRGHFADAKIAANQKDTAATEHAYRAAVTYAPDSVVAYTSLANYYLNTKRPKDAMATIEQLGVRRPQDPMSAYYFARFSGVTGIELDRGESAMRKYIALPENPADKTRATPATAHLRLGDILLKKGDKPGARREYETALNLNPKLEAASAALKSLK